jgi:hypothetical protein
MSRTLVVVAVFGLILLVAPVARAGVLAPSKPSQLVTLSTDGTVCPFDASAFVFNTRIAGDGTLHPFAIPAGDVLVVSSFDGIVVAGTASSTQDLVLLVPPGIIVATAPEFTLSGAGKGAAARDLTTPLVVRPGTTLCIGSDFGASVFRGLVHGFFAQVPKSVTGGGIF